MASREVVLAAANVLVEILRRRTHRKRYKRKSWVREWIKKRRETGASNTFLKELLVEDCTSYCNHLKVTSSQFTFLFRKVEGNIQRNETVMRIPLPTKLKLEVTLRYLATGDFLRVPKNLQRIWGMWKRAGCGSRQGRRTCICIMASWVCKHLQSSLGNRCLNLNLKFQCILQWQLFKL
jgi:hypothetical protein